MLCRKSQNNRKRCLRCNVVEATHGKLCERCYNELYKSKNAYRLKHGGFQRGDKDSSRP